VLISGVVALTLTPMMSSKMLKQGSTETGLSKKIAANFDWIRNVYSRALDVSLRNRPAVYVVWIGLSIAAMFMFSMAPAELAPTEDEGAIFTILDAPANSSLELISNFSRAASALLMALPETDFTFEVIFPTNGFGGLITKPWRERDRSTAEVWPMSSR